MALGKHTRKQQTVIFNQQPPPRAVAATTTSREFSSVCTQTALEKERRSLLTPGVARTAVFTKTACEQSQASWRNSFPSTFLRGWLGCLSEDQAEYPFFSKTGPWSFYKHFCVVFQQRDLGGPAANVSHLLLGNW